MDEFLRRLTRVHRRDIPAAPPESRSASSSGHLLDYLMSSTTSPDYPGNLSLTNETTTASSFLPMGTAGADDGHVRSNDSFPLSSFAVIKAVVLAIVLGILLLTSCRVVGKIICKKSSKDESQ